MAITERHNCNNHWEVHARSGWKPATQFAENIAFSELRVSAVIVFSGRNSEIVGFQGFGASVGD